MRWKLNETPRLLAASILGPVNATQVAAGLLFVAALCGFALLARRFFLVRRPGGFECGLRVGEEKRWRTGIASYQVDALRWYRFMSFDLGPVKTWPRDGAEVLSCRPATPEDKSPLPGDCVVVTLAVCGENVVMILHEDASVGLASWLESGPAGPLTSFN